MKSHHPKVCHFYSWGFQGGASGKNLPPSARVVRDLGSVHGLGRSPGGQTAQQLTLVFLPGESHGQRSLEGLQSMRLQRVGRN